MHKLLIIGSLHENINLVKEAKKQSYYVIVCDGYKDGVAKQYADKYYDIDVADIDSIVEMCKKEEIDGIVGSFSDYVFEQITKIADKVGLNWYVSTDMLKYYRDKDEQKKLLEKLGIATPKHILITDNITKEDYSNLDYPVVIKPIDSWGSRGITVLDTCEELKSSLDSNNYQSCEIEEFCDAYEFNCISWVTDSKVSILGIGDRERNPREKWKIPTLNRVVYPSKYFDMLHDQAVNVLQKFINYTGQKSGPISMQFFYKNNEIYVNEIAGRVLGHEHKLINMCDGSDVNTLLVDMVYKNDSEVIKDIKPINISKCACGIYFLLKKNIRLADTSKVDSLLANIDEDCKLVFCKEGEEFTDSHPYYAKVYLLSDSRGDLDKQTELLFNEMCVKDKDGNNIVVPFHLERRVLE